MKNTFLYNYEPLPHHPSFFYYGREKAGQGGVRRHEVEGRGI